MTQSAYIFSKFFSLFIYRHVIIDLIGRVELNPGADPNIHDIRKVQYRTSHTRERRCAVGLSSLSAGAQLSVVFLAQEARCLLFHLRRWVSQALLISCFE